MNSGVSFESIQATRESAGDAQLRGAGVFIFGPPPALRRSSLPDRGKTTFSPAWRPDRISTCPSWRFRR